MIQLEKNFLKEEIRCGFTVPEMMKRAWAVELEVLSEIDRICKSYGLTYYAFWGTLIGAVRHKGFIPWDDDIDIAMPRKDYQMLMKILPDELPEGYYNSSSYADQTHNQPLTSIMNTKTIITDSKKRERFFGCPYICGIDIFPLDFITRDEELAETQRNLYTIVYSAAREFEQYKKNGEAEKYLQEVEHLCQIRVERNGNERNQLWLLLDRIAGLFTEEESDMVTYLPTNICYRPQFYMNKEWFKETVEMAFEHIKIPVPVGYDKVLRSYYGDYIIPSYDAGRAHDYPFYKKQEEFLRSHGLQ